MKWINGRWRLENCVFVLEKDVEFFCEFKRERERDLVQLCW